MKKKELIKGIVDNSKLGVNYAQVEEVLETAMDHFKIALLKDKKKKFLTYFTAEIRVRAARKGVNPSTGESIQIPKKQVLKLKGLKSFLDILNK